MERTDILVAFKNKVTHGKAVIGGGAGIGLSAKCAEAAGLDFIVVYNSGRYRMSGISSMAGLMPYGDANAIVMEMSGEILPVVTNTPVIAGVCGTDPFRLMRTFLPQVKETGFSGVQNYPTVCLFEGTLRANLEETGLGFDREALMIRQARELDLLTFAYVTSEQELRLMTDAGADVLVLHMGLTISGMTGAKTALTLDEAIERLGSLSNAAAEARPGTLVLCHGGPIVGPSEVKTVLAEVPGIHGFLGASSMERLPTEAAMVNHMESYMDLGLRDGELKGRK
jgi:predicted TIM-barrel enzyme